jgi:hypothetical protein
MSSWTDRGALFCGRRNYQDGRWVTRIVTVVKSKLAAVSQQLQRVTNMLWHGARSFNGFRTPI